MKQIYFTSDHHFGHENIIKFCDRPFRSVEEMDQTLIERWNEKVKPEDEVYHLGDFSLAKDPQRVSDILDSLKGTKYLIIETLIFRYPLYLIDTCKALTESP